MDCKVSNALAREGRGAEGLGASPPLSRAATCTKEGSGPAAEGFAVT